MTDADSRQQRLTIMMMMTMMDYDEFKSESLGDSWLNKCT